MSTQSSSQAARRDASELAGGIRPVRRADGPERETVPGAHAVGSTTGATAEHVREDRADNAENNADREVDFRIELGRTAISPDKLNELREGYLLALDNGEQEPIEIFVQGRLAARGEIVVLEDQLGVRIIELVAPPPW